MREFVNRNQFFGRLLSVGLFLFAQSTFAITVTSKADGNWNSAGTWDMGVPGPTDDVVIAAGTTVTLDISTASLTSLTINAGGTLITTSPYNVTSGTITVNGTYTNGSTGPITVSTDMTVNSGGTLQMGSATAIITGTGNFTLASGSTLGVSSVDGITVGAAGNVQVSGTRTYNTGANYIYNGTSNQDVGDGLTQNTPANIEINNAGNTVSLGASTGLTGNLLITAGTLNTNGQTLTFSGAGAQSISAPTASITIDGLTVNKGGGTLTVGGSIATINLSDFTETLGNFTAPTSLNVSGNFALISGTYTAGTNTTVSGDWSNSGATFVPNGGTFTFNKAAGTQTLNSGGSSFNKIVHSGTGTLQLISNSLSTGGTFINSSGIFDANSLSHTVTGLATISGGTYSASSGTQNFNGGLTISGGTFGGSGGAVNATNLTLSSGSLTAPSGAFNISSAWTYNGGTFTPGGGTVTFNGTSPQTIGGSAATTFNNLTTANTTNTFAVQSTIIGGSLTVANGTTFTVSTANLEVDGTTLVGTGTSGSIVISNSSSTKDFKGLLLISTGGAWTNTANAPITFENGISNSGTFTAGSGVQTFAVNDQGLMGTFSIPNVLVNGVNLTNNNNLTVSTTLSGATGTLTQAAGATLNVGGAIDVNTFNTSGAANTVLYTGASQTVRAISYQNLTISQTSGEAILEGATTVNGTLTLSARNLDLGGYILTLGASASIADASPSASRMIIASGGGEVRKTFTAVGSFTFPIGDNTGMLEYSPVTVNLTAAGGFSSAYIGTAVIDAKHPNNASTANYLTRYWEVTSSGITSPVVNLSASYPSADIVGAEASIAAAQLDGTFDQSANPWVKYSGLAGNTLTANGVPLTDGQTSVFTGIRSLSPTISINNGATVSVCQGSNVVLSTTLSNGLGTPLYTWAPVTDLSSSSIPNPTYTGNTVGGPVNYVVTVTDANGITSTANIDVTVTSTPVITNTPAQLQTTICSGTALNFTPTSSVGGTTYAWTSSIAGTISGASVTASGSGAITDSPVNTGNTTGTVTYTITPTVGTCNGATKDYVVTVNPVPSASASNQTICSGSSSSVAITAAPKNVVGTTYTWVVFSSANITGASGGTGALISQVLSSTNGTTNGTVTYRITPSANGCNGPTTDVTVTVTPTPVITNTPAQLQTTICSGTALNFTPTSSVGGTTYAWTSSIAGTISAGSVTASGSGAITDSPVNTGNTTGTVTYTITPTVGTCNGATKDYVVTVNPVPTASASNQTICSGTSSSVAIAATPTSVAGTTYTWVVFSSANITGASGGTGALISQALSSTNGTTNGTVTYRITPTANGCNGPTTDVTVTAKPVPAITDAPTQLTLTVCGGTTLNFTPSSTIGGTTYSWTTSVAGPVTGVTASGSGAITDTPANTGNISGTVTYTITPSFNGCSGTPVNYVVTVQPIPSASGTNVTVCSSQDATISLSAAPKNVAGTTFSWIAVPTANVTGSSNGNGSVISQTLSTTNASVGTVTYQVTPVANGCTGPVTNIVATVNPIATVNAGADYSVCEPATILVSGTVGGSASSGTWSIVSGNGSISASSSGTTVTATYTVDPSDVSTTIILRLSTNDPDGGGPCSVLTDDLNITINRKATVTVPANFTVCEPTQISLVGNYGGGATGGAWSIVTGAGSMSVSSITGAPTFSVSATYTTAAGDIGNVLRFRLTSNDPDGSGPCSTVSSDVLVTVHRAAQVSAGANFSVCEYSPINLNGSFGGSATSVTWTGGSGSYADNNSAVTTYNMSAAEKNATNLTLNFTLTTNDPDGAGPCLPAIDNLQVVVNDTVNFVDFTGLKQPSYSENDPHSFLSAFPPGGIFTGPGMVAGTNEFIPAFADIGSINTILYSYTDANSCLSRASHSTIVNPVTSNTFDLEGTSKDINGNWQICANTGLIHLRGTPDVTTGHIPSYFDSPDSIIMHLPSGTINQIAGQYYINTANLPAGTYVVVYQYKNQFDAISKYSQTVIVYSSPQSIIDVANACVVDAITFNEASTISPNGSGANIVSYNWLFGDGKGSIEQNPTYKYDSANTYLVSLEVTTDQGCSDISTKSIRVGPVPKVDFTWEAICTGDKTKFSNATVTGISSIDSLYWSFADTYSAKGIPTDSAMDSGGFTSGSINAPNHAYGGQGRYGVTLRVLTNDGCSSQTVKKVDIQSFTTPSTLRNYFENFDNGPGTWKQTSQTDTSWVSGPPSGLIIDTDASGSGGAWWTGANTNPLDNSTFYPSEQSAVIGPCLNISNLDRPMVSLDYWSDTEAADGAVLQYSLDGGGSWLTIGDDNSNKGINWYNTAGMAGNPGRQLIGQYGWSGESSGWKTARYNLDGIPAASRGRVIFRIAFGSNSDNVNSVKKYEGFAFDNFFVGDKQRNVLLEHFTNSGIVDDWPNTFDTFYNDQFKSNKQSASDFQWIEYHVAQSGKTDQYNLDNPTDPANRKSYYGVQQPPKTIMDGIITSDYYGDVFNGSPSNISEDRIDRRALEDPLFRIQIDTIAAPSNTIKADVSFTYLNQDSSMSSAVTMQLALVESITPTGSGVSRLILRRFMMGQENLGITPKITWKQKTSTDSTTYTVNVNKVIDVPIVDPTQLYLIAFVQDNNPDPSNFNYERIDQMQILKIMPKTGSKAVGIPDDPLLAEIKDILVYPNPANNYLNLKTDNPLNHDYQYQLIDERGVVVRQGMINRNITDPQSIPVRELPDGVYILIISNDERHIIYKKIAVMNRN